MTTRHTRPAWTDRPHEIREDVSDGSMCLCGLPIDDNHDAILARPAPAAPAVVSVWAQRARAGDTGRGEQG